MTEPTEYGISALAKLVGRGLATQKDRVLTVIDWEELLLNWPLGFWEDEEGTLAAIFTPALQDIAIWSATTTNVALGSIAGETPIVEAILDWVSTYSFDLCGGINDTSRGIIEKAFDNFFSRPGFTRADFDEAIGYVFGPSRAESIAVTEATRAHFVGSEIVATEIRKTGLEMIGIWNTNADGFVCEICAPLHLTPESPDGGWSTLSGPGAYPPAHPRCRCWVTYEIA